MRTTKSAILATLFLTGSLAAQEAKRPVFRDAATHEDLVPKFQASAQVNSIGKLDRTGLTDPSVENQPPGLIETSDIVSFGGLTTLVPKQAIMQLPESFKDRVGSHQPGNRIVNWTEFHTANRGWITTVEVTRAQAEGNKEIAEEVAKQLSKSSNMVVATYKGGPISMLPPKAPPASETEGQASLTQP